MSSEVCAPGRDSETSRLQVTGRMTTLPCPALGVLHHSSFPQLTQNLPPGSGFQDATHLTTLSVLELVRANSKLETDRNHLLPILQSFSISVQWFIFSFLLPNRRAKFIYFYCLFLKQSNYPMLISFGNKIKDGILYSVKSIIFK